ncbi:LysE family translocator [Patulibacter sp. SYSU D01012]|uniref:LysE family translocator n=1 Tax=Patulibacter sp. SYSU D01012 TaxID=2817381 RepID=UPI001B314131|nr:LysE family translocator [Patulibacter sp. SYSU D01012]
MPPSDHVLAFLVASAVTIGVPGPSVLFVISRSITLGRRAGVATVVGNALGVYVQVILVAFGLGAIVERSVTAFTVVKIAGALYLMYLGIKAFRHRRDLATAVGQPVTPKTVRRIVREGFLVGLANPKSIVAFMALLPQFVDRAAGGVPQQMLMLGAMWFAIALVLDGAWALLAGTARGWLAGSPKRLEAIGGAGGLTMVGIGASLAFTGRKD